MLNLELSDNIMSETGGEKMIEDHNPQLQVYVRKRFHKGITNPIVSPEKIQSDLPSEGPTETSPSSSSSGNPSYSSNDLLDLSFPECDLRKMGSEANFVSVSIPKFDGNYDHWSMVMENLLRSKEYWVVVESGYSQPTNMDRMTKTQKQNLEEMKLKDLKAKNYLFQSLDKSILKTNTQKETSK
ncbi:hypothetical protein KIW84_015310 [Lathyrus oleraceus]|uniref:Uncharacterized protein n=1 Tax=Pisum sativum TaxID=3888 RepID=A0A9D5H073_PEA|nr:hypothetical protein KIW84_015310 [Pisum sativum]